MVHLDRNITKLNIVKKIRDDGKWPNSVRECNKGSKTDWNGHCCFFYFEETVTLSMIRPIMHSIVKKHLVIHDDDRYAITAFKTTIDVDLSSWFQLE